MTLPFTVPWLTPFPINAEELREIQSNYMSGWQAIYSAMQQGNLSTVSDRRFSSQAWSDQPAYLAMAHMYLLSTRTLNQMVEAADIPEDLRSRLRFSVQQWLDAMAPSNYLATNPEAQQLMLETQGQSLLSGISNLFADLQKGRMSQTDESQFALGENLAVTEGQVVFQNSIFQLIQYAPQTSTVYRRPLLMVPPCINKYYILDLQAENSFVRYAVEAGLTVYMVSWRNPTVTDTDGIQEATWDDYIEDGVLKAIDVVRAISGQKQINALGFCVGGTLLATALAVAKTRQQQPVYSLTLLTTMLDFTDTGVLDVFVNEAHARLRELQFGQGGLMPASELATTFSFLRPNELVWNYVVNNYLKGQTPPPFDILYWNSDGTNIPGPFFTWYFRNTYLENKLKTPGAVKVCGVDIDFASLDLPAYIYGSREDHIVPWRSAYATNALLSGPKQFVLGASGHIAGVINPPAKKRRQYWKSDNPDDALTAEASEWYDAATVHQGSWWPDWLEWITEHSSTRKRALKRLGNADYHPIEPSPGSYVNTLVV